MASFDLAIEPLLRREGGYVNDPDDPGGETKYGISKAAYPDVDIKNLTIDKASAIYKKDYWDKSGLSEIKSQDIADKLFDMSVNLGSVWAIRLAQKAYNLLVVCGLNLPPVSELDGKILDLDGIMGPKTMAALNVLDCEGEIAIYLVFVERYLTLYYLALKKPKYLNGWLHRNYDNQLLKAHGY